MSGTRWRGDAALDQFLDGGAAGAGLRLAEVEQLVERFAFAAFLHSGFPVVGVSPIVWFTFLQRFNLPFGAVLDIVYPALKRCVCEFNSAE